MKKLILAAMSVLVFAGCNELNGTFEIQKSFLLKTTKGETQVNPGSYKTAMNYKKNKVLVSVKGEGGNINFELKTNSTPKIPANGDFQILKSESGQIFDIRGNNKTTVSKSSTKSTFETCSMPNNDVVCTPQGCYPGSGIKWGQKRVDYYTETTSRLTNFEFFDDVDAQSFAQFKGQQSDIRKIIVREGMCF